jgi:hypothetical protein
MMMTEVIFTSENTVANLEEHFETTARSTAQTRAIAPGEITPQIKDAEADAWVKRTREMRLNHVSAESWPLGEACSFIGIPIEDGVPILRPADHQIRQGYSWVP